ncbi:hypothetical protein SASPL_149277 [Salvia splendens]|uniref:RING-type domain-containing protein n=1 Tax=Salvia splendens TaxID=180675 RepID=A0A8X8WBF5_SALSN|nr:hypothetical protein SASPL_149277 [Salvia splendens]
MESEVPVTETLQLGPTRQRNIGEIGGRPQSTDPITLGFEQLNARFDKMDRRVANLERRADWDKRHRRYTQPTYRRPQHHQSDRYTPSPPYQPDRRRPYHLHQTRYQLPEHYHPFDYGPPPTYRGFPLRQFLQLQNEPSRQPSCWDPPGAGVSMGNLDYEEIASIYYPDYDCDSVGYGEDADVHHDPSSNSQLTVIVVPPPPPQRSQRCTVCLSDYHEEDTLCVLPVCRHLFHATCIGIWLQQRSTCPVCRISLRELPERKWYMQPMFSHRMQSVNAHYCHCMANWNRPRFNEHVEEPSAGGAVNIGHRNTDLVHEKNGKPESPPPNQ